MITLLYIGILISEFCICIACFMDGDYICGVLGLFGIAVSIGYFINAYNEFMLGTWYISDTPKHTTIINYTNHDRYKPQTTSYTYSSTPSTSYYETILDKKMTKCVELLEVVKEGVKEPPSVPSIAPSVPTITFAEAKAPTVALPPPTHKTAKVETKSSLDKEYANVYDGIVEYLCEANEETLEYRKESEIRKILAYINCIGVSSNTVSIFVNNSFNTMIANGTIDMCKLINSIKGKNKSYRVSFITSCEQSILDYYVKENAR